MTSPTTAVFINDQTRSPDNAVAVADPTMTMAERDAFMAQIPTETTPGERRLLYDLFRREWNGSGDVVEIGPFLGGTTRAIALGMGANLNLTESARLFTFDRFSAYYDPVRLRKTIQPLVPGLLSATRADDLCRAGDFLGVFEALHGNHGYYRLVSPFAAALPDFPDEVAVSPALSVLADHRDLGALFIDGCKSWASTRYAMEFLLPRTRTGAPVIFQDFGWYTCFWISAFTFALEDALEFCGHVDATYVFRLKRAVAADEVAARFALSPEKMGAGFFWRASTALLKASVKRGDARGALIAQLHLIAALVTLNQRDRAAAVLAKIDPKLYGPLASMIEGCRRSPTYGPGGVTIRWTDS